MKVISYDSHQNVKTNYLIFIEQPRGFFSSKFHKVFQTQTKLYQPKKAKEKNMSWVGEKLLVQLVDKCINIIAKKKNK